MDKIKSISEAFSMQPVLLETVSREYYNNYLKGNYKYSKNLCEKIIPEIRPNLVARLYVGYNFEGKKLFEYLESSVNVTYDVEEESNG